MRRLTSIVVFSTVLSMTAGAATAQSHPGAQYGIAPTPAPGPAAERDWYGWQIALADLSVAALTLVDQRFIYLHLASGPIVHFAHGEMIHGTVSVGLRVTVPWLVGQGAGGLAELQCNDDQRNCDDANRKGAFVGRAVAAAVVSVAELVWLSFESHQRDRHRAVLELRGITARPIAATTSRGVLVGLAGSF